MIKKDLAVLYPVAGMSSRFGGKMKWLIKVGPRGESLIEYSVDQALRAGFNKIIFIVSEKTVSYFKEIFGGKYKGANVFYAFQEFDVEKRDRPWGTVDALCCGLPLMDCPTVFCNGDDIYGEETFKIIAEHFRNANEDVCVGYRLKNVLPDKGSVNRARFHVEEDYVKGLIEFLGIGWENLGERDLNEGDLISMNIFGFLPETVGKLNDCLIRFREINEDSRDAECLLPNEVGGLVKRGLKMRIYPTPCKWYGVTNPEDEGIVREALLKERVLSRW